jgi:hypothetical protein
MKRPIKYQGVSLPTDLMIEINDFIKDKDFRSIADFVKQAVKDKMSIKPALEQSINHIIESDDWFTIRKRDDGLYERIPKDEATKDLLKRVRELTKKDKK